MQQPDQYLEHLDLSSSHHSSRTFTGGLYIEDSCTRLLHYVLLYYVALALQYLSDLTHVYTPARSLRSSSDTRILRTSNVRLSHMVIVLLPSMVPLHGILCHSHSDINRNLTVSSEL